MANIFFSYSHKDEGLRNELEVHLAMLKRQGLIRAWHDRRIGAGKDVHSNISDELESADIILLLVSASFLASDYCYDREMTRALEKDKQRTARVIPVILHPCDWHSAPFGSLRATPPDGKPVSMFANQDEALTQVVKDIRAAVEELGISLKKRVTLSEQHLGAMRETISPRSGNMRVKTKFTDQEIDDFLESSFEYMARFFAASLDELQNRNKNITAKFRQVDANCFTASIYDEGTRASECTVWTGGDSYTSIGGIGYYGGITTSRNQYNESLSVENDGYSLHLRPMGMTHFGMGERDVLS
uniref:TIR domain-containing protein n=1 Tax=Candidatus Kentrum sp. MB TaxID=2138164 RepID=A0A450XN38_9GAMM|nr:MAG: TIR domain-containing protein [Candidatus Kentron sp. MB]VFK34245.1 MAG: TIR domain-containing protein [Candidatus Kentron sp. MB]VFK76609.1 MAG: TIR domain-containing protein [Candidatus Kentron sp. MB]